MRLRPIPGGQVIARDLTDEIKRRLDGGGPRRARLKRRRGTADRRPVPASARPAWARVDDDGVMQWPVIELAEWEELRAVPRLRPHLAGRLAGRASRAG